MRSAQSQRRTDVIQIRLSDKEKRAVAKAAAQAGTDMSTWVRRLVAREIG